MFKKSLIAVLFSLIMAMVLGTSAFAQTDIPPVKYDTSKEMTPEITKAIENINLVNAEIESEINKAQKSSEEIFAAYQLEVESVESISEKNKLYSVYNKKINTLINDLKATTRELTKNGMKAAREAGINTRPELIRVEFADRFAMIDPMVVVGW
ncbi:hypothetical protein FQV26_02200 [Planococcus sp. CPCC 101016]|uniref:hypothetical protein n=1 Tax=Planococcus sp. CPCC 101016 TaxID=2599617 RepID=UPI0011B7A0E6|nr:hypothetical protein [Planococcus sp. CPCC 101016]TWT06642.1 hypothetical protein FQV26_02200 [Planococcus sp. CPCC 101016]